MCSLLHLLYRNIQTTSRSSCTAVTANKGTYPSIGKISNTRKINVINLIRFQEMGKKLKNIFSFHIPLLILWIPKYGSQKSGFLLGYFR